MLGLMAASGLSRGKLREELLHTSWVYDGCSDCANLFGIGMGGVSVQLQSSFRVSSCRYICSGHGRC